MGIIAAFEAVRTLEEQAGSAKWSGLPALWDEQEKV
jgi:hypothetical protein